VLLIYLVSGHVEAESTVKWSSRGGDYNRGSSITRYVESTNECRPKVNIRFSNDECRDPLDSSAGLFPAVVSIVADIIFQPYFNCVAVSKISSQFAQHSAQSSRNLQTQINE
jgi:hypothetical protein